MISTCPSCLAQVEHEDHEFEVICDCGSRFNPFAAAGDLPPIDAEMSSVDSNPDDFSESSSAFAEIVNFGESVETPTPPAGKAAPGGFDEEPAAGEITSSKPAVRVKTSAPIPTGEVILTAGPVLQGYKVSGYLGMISSSQDLDLASEDPLKSLFDALAAKAEGLGANGVISCSWWISTDGAHAIGSGSAIRIERDEPLES